MRDGPQSDTGGGELLGKIIGRAVPRAGSSVGNSSDTTVIAAKPYRGVAFTRGWQHL
jgi:hypothetical protein